MPFVKGDVNINRGGRPRKGKSLTETLEKAMKKKRDNGMKNIDALADALIELAIQEKNIAAVKYLCDRLDGRPVETVALENGNLEIKLQEIFYNDK
jgi:hypothetical protein